MQITYVQNSGQDISEVKVYSEMPVSVSKMFEITVEPLQDHNHTIHCIFSHLNSLPVLMEYVDSHNCFIQSWICRLD